MNRVWFAGELETVATYWRIHRRDGVTLGLTSHDRDLCIADIHHRTAPGMVPSAIRMSADFERDSAEVTGALAHDAINAADLALGRYDGARVEMGLADWRTLETHLLYAGTIGRVGQSGERFTAELHSVKAQLARDPIPRTSPTCRAIFCGPGCNLSGARYDHEAVVASIDFRDNALTISGAPAAERFLDGSLRWIDGPSAGRRHRVAAIDGERLVLDPLLDPGVTAGLAVQLREGCDHRLESCAGRFGNAVNFQGEPFLPGNDLLARYPGPGS